MTVSISYCDLAHEEHFCNAVPFGIGMVAAYAAKVFGSKIESAIFKRPAEFINFLEKKPPQIACFSSYIWNANLSLELAKQIKSVAPETIIIFGGPNYPIVPQDQKTYLKEHPYVDFFIYRDGELAFVDLLENIFEYDFKVNKLKKDEALITNCHYFNDEHFIQGTTIKPLKNMDELPSPYVSGIMDKFIKAQLTPLLQTARGCPFTCTFCQEGDRYYSSIRRFSQEHIKEELEYLAKNAKMQQLVVADSNFGMYKQDLDTCRSVKEMKDKYNWPNYFGAFGGKNNKERVLEAVKIVGGVHQLSAAIQSTDLHVLESVGRKNINFDNMFMLAKEGEKLGTDSFSEIILALPGDSKKSHFQSIEALLDAGMNVARVHQFIMLPASEASTAQDREKFKMITRFRVTPDTAMPYTVFGKVIFSPEIDEICVANNTMTFQDYQDCRLFNLTVEIFYNNSIFRDLFKFLKHHEITVSKFILNIHEWIICSVNDLTLVYNDFIRETNELFETRQQLEAYLQEPGVIEKYQRKELGNNEQLIYRGVAVFKHMDTMHQVVYEVANSMCEEAGVLEEKSRLYLSELKQFSLLRKNNILATKTSTEEHFHFDFINLIDCQFNEDPMAHYSETAFEYEFLHTEEQQAFMSNYVDAYGITDTGLGNLLSRSDFKHFFRTVKPINDNGQTKLHHKVKRTEKLTALL